MHSMSIRNAQKIIYLSRCGKLMHSGETEFPLVSAGPVHRKKHCVSCIYYFVFDSGCAVTLHVDVDQLPTQKAVLSQLKRRTVTNLFMDTLPLLKPHSLELPSLNFAQRCAGVLNMGPPRNLSFLDCQGTVYLEEFYGSLNIAKSTLDVVVHRNLIEAVVAGRGCDVTFHGLDGSLVIFLQGGCVTLKHCSGLGLFINGENGRVFLDHCSYSELKDPHERVFVLDT